MKKVILLIAVFFLFAASVNAQNSFGEIGKWQPINFAPDDTTSPWFADQGCRHIGVTQDVDQDGKQEILATDYSAGGRVHVLEMNGGVLEVVWSSPAYTATQANSVPRWAIDADLDGDGNREIIFPHGPRYDGQLEVWEWDGSDNSFGAQPAIVLPGDQYTTQGLGRFRMDRERGEAFDFDGDGKDELIMANEDNAVYILGIVGSFPGFASWQLEGGDPAVVAENRFSGGSWWHSAPADLDGDGEHEIINHYWNFFGFWNIEVDGVDSYIYPTPTADGRTDHYYEYLQSVGADAVAYMGIVVADVDGDGNDELAGPLYISPATDSIYDIALVNVDATEDVYNWDNDPVQFGVIAEDIQNLMDDPQGSHWGAAAYDFNGNGKEELLIGGVGGNNITRIEYKGTGDLTDSASYDKEIYYSGIAGQYFGISYYDSLGTIIDTVYSSSPFVSRMFAPADLNGNGKMEAVMAFQSIADSVTYTYYSWQLDSLGVGSFIKDSSSKVAEPNAANIRVAEYEEGSGFNFYDIPLVTPDDYVLEQNYPNPFNPTTTIRFAVPVEKQISLVIYDILGNKVKTLINNEVVAKGAYEAVWDGTNNANQEVASGNYIYQLQFGNFTKTAKMTLLK